MQSQNRGYVNGKTTRPRLSIEEAQRLQDICDDDATRPPNLTAEELMLDILSDLGYNLS